jgi:hypothetical protein
MIALGTWLKRAMAASITLLNVTICEPAALFRVCETYTLLLQDASLLHIDRARRCRGLVGQTIVFCHLSIAWEAGSAAPGRRLDSW